MSLPTGRRVVVEAWGETPLEAVSQHLSVVDQPVPQLGPTEVLLRVRACAVGWVDLLMMSGQYQHMVQPPYTPGLEFAGEVAAVGDAVRAVSVGDAVLADALHTGPRSHGDHRDGGFATYAVIPEHAALPLPGTLSFDQAVNLLGNYETAYHVLLHRGRLRAGETVLVCGASGSTGLAAVHVAKLVGATVIATGRSEAKLAEVAAQGADHVLATGDADGGVRRFRDEVKELTGGRGVDVVYDGVGGPISVECIRSMAFGGRFCIVGWAATPFVAKGKGGRGAPRANQLPTNLIQMKGLDVLGCPAMISVKKRPELREERLAWVLERVGEGRLVPHVGPTFGLEDVVEALRAKWSSRFVGGCVLRP